jgi:hypothetical protein
MGFLKRKKLDELSNLHSDFKLESGYHFRANEAKR